MASRIILRIELTAPAKKALESMTDKKGMTQVAMLSRLVEWLALQPAAVQTAVLAQNASETQAETARLIARQMGPGKKA
ncbi:MAG: hypothetical protein ABSH20_09240 [Tepidisphaeraceae bacterium]|jgi:hypothetical protein